MDALSSDQMAQIVEAARFGEGAPPETARPERRRKSRRIREIDFTKPTKFTKEQVKRIEREHETFCRTTANRLTTELRAEMDLSVSSVSQFTLAAALSEMPAGSLFAVLIAEPISTPILLGMDGGAVLAMMERLLGAGGDPVLAPCERELTDIERSLARRLFTIFVEELSPVWSDLLGVTLRLDRIESQLMNVQLASPSEPTLGISVEHIWGELSSNVWLVVPYRSIEEVVDRLPSSQADLAAIPSEDSDAARKARAMLATVDVEFRVEIGTIELPLERVLSLRPGDVVSLGRPAGAGVTVFADRVPTHVARPGRRGSRRAVEIVGRSD